LTHAADGRIIIIEKREMVPVFKDLEARTKMSKTRILLIGKARFGISQDGEKIDVLCLNDAAETHISRCEGGFFQRRDALMRSRGLDPIRDYDLGIEKAAAAEAWGYLESRVFKLLKIDGNGGKGLKIYTPFSPGYESAMDEWKAARPERLAA